MLEKLDILFKKYFKRIRLQSKNLFIICLIAALTPFLILSLFIHPCFDDYWLATIANRYGFWDALSYWMHNLGCRYFVIASLLGYPLVFNLFIAVKIFSTLFILLSITAIYALLKELYSGSHTSKECIAASLVLFFLYLYQMPSIVYGFYYISSGFVYQLPIIMALFFTTLILKLNRVESRRTNYKLTLTTTSIFLIFAIIGSNEILMVFLDLALVFIFLNGMLNNPKLKLMTFLMTLTAILASVYVLYNTGTSQRLSLYIGNRNLFHSLLQSIRATVRYTIYYWTLRSPLLWVTTFFAISFNYKWIRHQITIGKNTNRIHPFVSFFLSFLILTVSFFPVYYSTNMDSPLRTLNLISFLFLILWFINISVLLMYLYSKYHIELYIPNYILNLLIILFFSILLSNGSPIRIAYMDLFSGTAYYYNEELKERYNMIKRNYSKDICEVNSLNNTPATIHLMTDISTDEKETYNMSFAEYFKKKAVRLKNK